MSGRAVVQSVERLASFQEIHGSIPARDWLRHVRLCRIINLMVFFFYMWSFSSSSSFVNVELLIELAHIKDQTAIFLECLLIECDVCVCVGGGGGGRLFVFIQTASLAIPLN